MSSSKPTESKADDKKGKIENQHAFNSSECQSNYHLSLHSLPSYPYCFDGSSPIIVSVITFLNTRKMSGFSRAEVILSLANTLGICSDLLVIDSIEWSTKNGMKLWSQIAEHGIIENLDLTTTLSFQVSCSALDWNSKSLVQMLSRLDDIISNQPMPGEILADQTDETILFSTLVYIQGN